MQWCTQHCTCDKPLDGWSAQRDKHLSQNVARLRFGLLLFIVCLFVLWLVFKLAQTLNMENAFMCCLLMTQLKVSLGKQQQHFCLIFVTNFSIDTLHFCTIRYRLFIWDFLVIYRVGRKKPGLFLRVDNFATVNGRKVCDMSYVSEFCLDKV